MRNESPTLILLPYESCSGLELFGIRFAEHLLKRGNSAVIAAPKDSLIACQCKDRGIPITNVPAFKKRDPRAFYYCCKILKNLKPKAIIAFRTQMMYPVNFAKTITGHRPPFYLFYRIGAGNYYRIDPLHRILFKKLEAVIPNADHVKNKILKYWAIDPQKVICIKSGVDTNKYKPDKQRRISFRKEIGIDNNAFLIGNTGRIHPEKGSEILINSLFSETGVARNNKNVHLVHVGREYKKGYIDYLKNIAKKHNAESQIHFAPFRNDIETMYSALDLFAFAVTSHETYAYVVLEAMASGLPVIVPSTGGMKEMFTHEKEGFFFEHRNTEELKEMLQKAILMPSQKLLEMGTLGRNRIINTSSWDIMMNKYYEVFKKANIELAIFGKDKKTLYDTICNTEVIV